MPMIRRADSSTPHRFTPSAPVRGGLPYLAPFPGAKPFPRQGIAPTRAMIGPAA